MRFVERGGLAGAILVCEPDWSDELALFRAVRSVDQALPCWLVAERPSRRTLQAALALDAISVIVESTADRELVLAMFRLFSVPYPRN